MKQAPFTFVMRLTLVRLQKEMNFNNAQMADFLGLSERQVKRLRTHQERIPAKALQLFEQELIRRGWQ